MCVKILLYILVAQKLYNFLQKKSFFNPLVQQNLTEYVLRVFFQLKNQPVGNENSAWGVSVAKRYVRKALSLPIYDEIHSKF